MAPLFNTPVLLLNFNRPDLTTKLVASLQAVRPTQIFVAIDGPRAEVKSDEKDCNSVFQVLREGLDWECKITWSVSDINKGCGRAVSEAITWFFEHVEEGIILEDDCIPSSSFMYFSETMLQCYRNDTRVGTISGSSFLPSSVRLDTPIWFSKYAQIWGWATWKRVWEKYDYSLKTRDIQEWEKIISNHNPNAQENIFWMQIFEDMIAGKIDTWDYQLIFSCWKEKQLHISPLKNLVTNLGFRSDATHTHHRSHLNAVPALEQDINDLEIIPPIQNADLDNIVFYLRWLESLKFTWWLEKPILAKFEENIVVLNKIITANAEHHDEQLKEASHSAAREREAFQQYIAYLKSLLEREYKGNKIQRLWRILCGPDKPLIG